MESKIDPSMKKTLLVINVILLGLGNCGGPLILRLYYIHGGKLIWLASALETGGWPLTLMAVIVAYSLRRRSSASTKVWYTAPRVIASAAVAGVLTGLDDYLYAFGVSRLPISTASLIIASQLGFTAIFAFILVKQKFTPYSVNPVVLLTVGAGVLAMHSSSDMPEGESKREYIVGFLMTVGASALYGFVLPLVELSYNKARQAISYTVVLEFQLVMCFFATLVCFLGMLINHNLKVKDECSASKMGADLDDNYV